MDSKTATCYGTPLAKGVSGVVVVGGPPEGESAVSRFLEELDSQILVSFFVLFDRLVAGLRPGCPERIYFHHMDVVELRVGKFSVFCIRNGHRWCVVHGYCRREGNRQREQVELEVALAFRNVNG